jgi:hypothetical protein
MPSKKSASIACEIFVANDVELLASKVIPAIPSIFSLIPPIFDHISGLP